MGGSYTDMHEHAFDAKGRITVPSEWRSDAFEKNLYAFEARDCVKVYPASALSRLQEQIRGLESDDPKRLRVEILAGMAQSVTWDEQGRIMIKERLRKAAGLAREAVLLGRLSYFQIEDRSRFRKQEGKALAFEDAIRGLGM